MRERERGFTLIELLLSVTVLGIIMAAVVSALIVYLRTGADASRRDDHSGGAAIAASYLQRDLASADTSVVGGTSCSGMTNALTFSWTEYAASPASPTPAPTGGTWTAAYALTSYSATDVAGNPTRYRLRRWYCPPGVSSPTPALIVQGLGAASDLSVTIGATGSCTGGSLLKLVLARYVADSGSDYSVNGCVKGRLS